MRETKEILHVFTIKHWGGLRNVETLCFLYLGVFKTLNIFLERL